MAAGFEGDVRKREDAKRVIESTFEHFGKIDILVNGAAGNFLVSPEDLSPNGFRTVLDIDAVGTFTMCHEALHYLKKGGLGRSSSGGGIILNISATLHYTAAWYQINVAAAKAAVDAIGRNLALEWGTDYDIRVNGIAPGPIGGTPGMSKLVPEEINSKADDSDAARKFVPLTAPPRLRNSSTCLNSSTLAEPSSPPPKRCSQAAFSSCGKEIQKFTSWGSV
ncbi:hypothetical protein OIU77_018104 [Salix suchowensis]|uniref:2,4-dienoyl-CoA reductase [(3E)-enoyl-CoA-producing] n=1 Tax=Salix suchowensis TaxID=1278906 RepID=A0ABQ8ZRD3_9ROSI|nr:hypothetical protein OIU77_018104 [Salix suchowensis]